MFLLFRKEDGGKMFLFLTFCEVFFFFVTSSPTLLLMINRESFNRHQDWLERRPGQSQAQMRKKEGRAQGCHPLPKQGNRWRNFVLREKLFSSKTDEVGTTYPQGKKKRSGPKHTWQRDLQADKTQEANDRCSERSRSGYNVHVPVKCCHVRGPTQLLKQRCSTFLIFTITESPVQLHFADCFKVNIPMFSAHRLRETANAPHPLFNIS